MTRRRVPIPEMALLIGGLAFVAPCGVALLNSFKTSQEITMDPLALPARFAFTSYTELFSGVHLLIPMRNSLLMTVAVIVGLIGTAPTAAYSIVRRRMASGRALELLFLAGLTIPFQVVLVPLLQEFRLLRIEFTYVALWLHYVSWGLPMCVFIYSRFLSTIPRELEEAAALDGCGPVATFWRVIFPLLRPCTASIIIFWGLWIWNDFVQAFVVMGPDRAHLAFVELFRYISDKYVKNWSTIFAGVVVLSAPVTILYLAMQRYFVKGLTAGSLK
jgi:raffinose/stachyose/melibiose transport system permease protein